MTWGIKINDTIGEKPVEPSDVTGTPPDDVLKLDTNNFNVIDSIKYGEKYFIAVMHPEIDNGGNVCIFSSSNANILQPENWPETPVHSFALTNSNQKAAFGHTLKIVSGSNELVLFYTQQDFQDPLLVITSSDGEQWSSAYSIGGNITSSYAGPQDGIGNDFDVIYEEDSDRYLMAFAASKNNQFFDGIYGYGGYGIIGSGSIFILSSGTSTMLQNWSVDEELTLPTQSIIESLNPSFTVTERLSGLYGNSVSLLKTSDGKYSLYASLPVNHIKVNGTSTYPESIWRHDSYDGSIWSSSQIACLSNEADYNPEITIDDFPLVKQHSFIGFSGIKAVEYNKGTYLFYTQPGSNNFKGSAFVSYGLPDDPNQPLTQEVSPLNKIRILDGMQSQEMFGSAFNLFSTNRRTFSVDAVSKQNGIHYSFGSPRYFDYRGAMYLGHSRDGINFEQAEQIDLEVGDRQQHPALGTSISFIDKEDTTICVYSDFVDIHIKTQGAKLVWTLDVESEKAQKAYRHAMLEPYFAPGILYNTIKSGMAVDWPAISGSTPFEIVDSETVQYRSTFYPDSIVMSSFSGSEGIYNSRGNLRSKIGYRVPFENLMNPEQVFPSRNELLSNSVYSVSLGNLGSTTSSINSVNDFIDGCYLYSGHETFINPVEVGQIYTKETPRYSLPFIYRINKAKNGNSLFSKAMSNYLAEIPEFFLKDEKMSSLETEPDYKWETMKSGEEYYMDLVVEKTKDLVMMESYPGQKHPTGSNGEGMSGRYFGYPIAKTTASMSEEQASIAYNDPAYSAYTPPYFEGSARMRLKFVPEENRKYSLDEIFSNVQIENIFEEAAQGWEAGSDAEEHKMKIESSFEVFDYKNAFSTEIESLGEYNDTDLTKVKEEKDSKVWVIRPRMETPILDFSSQDIISYQNNYLKDGGFGRGMWSGYGTLPDLGEGIQFRLENPFIKEGKKSLLDYVKFKNTSADLGKVAPKKKISEAIVLIPYVDTQQEVNTYGTKKQYVDNIHFIKIRKDVYSKQLKNVKANKNAVLVEDGVENSIVETSISRMIKTADRYVLPPNLNFFKYDSIEPFVMYFAEFEHELDSDDLSNIWQSQMPDISYSAEMDEVTITHEFTTFDLFNGVDIPKNLKWLIFKVKQKAETKYENMIRKTKGENFFIEKYEQQEPYGYNWPYDFFSLVEMAKVEISLEYAEGKEEIRPPIVGYTISE